MSNGAKLSLSLNIKPIAENIYFLASEELLVKLETLLSSKREFTI